MTYTRVAGLLPPYQSNPDGVFPKSCRLVYRSLRSKGSTGDDASCLKIAAMNNLKI